MRKEALDTFTKDQFDVELQVINSSSLEDNKVHASDSEDKRYVIFRKVRDEFQVTIRHYASDWTDAFERPRLTVSAAIVTFCSTLLTSIAFGLLFQVETDRQLGLVATLTSGGITGVIQAGVGGNPLAVCGSSGPITLLYIYAYRFAKGNGIPFAPWIAWIGFWSFLMHAATACAGLCKHRKKITHFSGQIFELLISADFLTTAIRGLVNEWGLDDSTNVDHDDGTSQNNARLNGLVSLLLATGFFSLAILLARAREWSFLSRGGNRFLAKFSTVLALVCFVALGWLPHWTSASWPRGVPALPDVQKHFGVPAEHKFLAFLDMGTVSPGAAVGAIIPAFLLTLLFFLDHNISAMNAYHEDFGCKKGQAFNYDFLTLGFGVLLTGLLGLPPSSGLIPQNPIHSRNLLYFPDSKPVSSNEPEETSHAWVDPIQLESNLNKYEDESGKQTENHDIVAKRFICEQRLSAMIHSLLLFFCIFLVPLVGWIPTCLIWAFFLLMSTEGLHAGNEFLVRVGFLFSSKGMVDASWSFLFLQVVPRATILRFTLLQIGCFTLVYIVAVILPLISSAEWVAVGAIFPALIMFYAVPFRSHIMPKYMFHEQHLQVLDHAESLCLESPIFQVRKDPDEDFTTYGGRGAPGLPHILRKDAVLCIKRDLAAELARELPLV